MKNLTKTCLWAIIPAIGIAALIVEIKYGDLASVSCGLASLAISIIVLKYAESISSHILGKVDIISIEDLHAQISSKVSNKRMTKQDVAHSKDVITSVMEHESLSPNYMKILNDCIKCLSDTTPPYYDTLSVHLKKAINLNKI